MKTKFLLFSAIISTIFIQYSCDADTARAICTGIARDCFEMGAIYAADQSLQTLGATQEESKQLINGISEIIGQKNANITRGLEITRSNDYQKQQMVLDVVENNVIPNSKDPSIQMWFDAARSNFQYRHDKAIAKTDEEKTQAEVDFAMRTNDIFYNAYQIKKTKNAERLAKKLEIVEQLKASGNYDPEWALEDAGFILAVMESKDLSEEEKNQTLQRMGFYQNTETIKEIVAEVTSPYYVDDDVVVEKPLVEEHVTKNDYDNISQQLKSIKVNSYELNATNLSEEQKQELDKAADILKQNDDYAILLIGHTCNIGDDNINIKIGKERALAAKEYLMTKGVSENRITIESKGKTQPLVPNTSEENQRKNRRVEIKLLND